MSKKFSVIVSDPPWSFSDTLQMSDVARGAAANYSTMTVADIKQMSIKDHTDPDGTILALWVPSSLLQDGLDVMKAWGFTHKQTYVWVKTKKDIWKDILSVLVKDIEGDAKSFGYVKKLWKQAFDLKLKDVQLTNLLSFGMGRLFRQTHELCLIGINNNKIYQKLLNKSQRSVSFGENLRHSAKPEHLQNALDIMFDGDKLELFARRERPGWTCLGNEVCNGEDIRISLSKLV